MAETLIKVQGGDTEYVNPLPASLFSTAKAYSIGNYCTYQGKVYRFTAAKAAGEWDGAKVTTVTNPAADTDTTLSIPGMAADAAAVGSKVILGYPIMITSTDRLEALVPSKSANDFPINKLISIGSQASTIGLINYAEIGDSTTGLYLTLNYQTTGYSGAKQLFINPYGIATRSHTNGSWTEWKVYQGDEYADSIATQIRKEFLGRYEVMITNASKLSDLTGGTNSADDFPANKIIYYSSSAPAAANGAQFAGNKGGYYLTLAYNGEVASGAMQLFFPRYGGLGTRLRVGSSWQPWIYTKVGEVKEYHVGPTREYTNLTDLWLDLVDDTSDKIVYVDPGTYDVFAEYRAAVNSGKLTPPPDDISTSNYKPYCVNIPSNTTVIGLGRVTLKWEPSSSQISDIESQIWSPVNIHGTNVHFENITITCKNGRYCLHDDPHNAFPGCRNTYKNVICYKKSNDSGKGFSIAQGMGYCDKGQYEFDNCKWFNEITGSSSAYCIGGHEGSTTSAAIYENGATVVFKHCVMIAAISNSMRFQTINSSGATQKITVDIDDCYLSGGIWLDQYNSSSGQFFDLTLVNSGNPNFTIDIGGDNPFPPKVYNAA